MRDSRQGYESPSSSEERLCGVHPITALLKQSPERVRCVYVLADPLGHPVLRLAEIVELCAQAKINVVPVPARTLGGMSPHPAHQGVVATTADFGYVGLSAVLASADGVKEGPLWVALDQVQDPHNLGAIARSALALGASGLLICERRSAQVTASAQKAAAGAFQHLPVARVTNLAQSLHKLRERGFWVIGTSASSPRLITDARWDGSTILVLGGEANGMRPLVQKHCDDVVAIPLASSSESLNVSVAAGLCLWQALCARRLDALVAAAR